jgi:hypothetical protein
MATNPNRIHFIDPVQDATVAADRVLVLRASSDYQTDRMLGTIVSVRKNRHFDGYHIWYVTTDGYHVQGAPINPPTLGHYQPVLGILSDDLFAVGTMAGRPYGADHPALRINNPIRSDRHTLGGAHGLPACHAETWVKAAPWAHRLMPLPTDGTQAATAKLSLAEQMFKMRKAQAEIIVQGTMRDHEEDLENLTQNHDLPVPVFGALVRGSAFIPANEDLGRESLDHVRAAASAAGDDFALSRQAYAKVDDFSFVYPSEARSREDVENFNLPAINRQARNLLQQPGLMLGAATLSPVLRNLA